MKPYLILAALAVAPFAGQAQFGKLLNKAKEKVAQRTESRVEKELDKAFDNTEGKDAAAAAEAQPQAAAAKEGTATQPTTVKAYSKFDFVPGERILYAEDFAQDAVGELPLTWNASGKGEVITVSNQPGKWLRMAAKTTYLTGNRKSFGENYTIEFDLMYFFEPKVSGYVLPGWKFGTFGSGSLPATDNKFLNASPQVTNTIIDFNVSRYANAKLEAKVNLERVFSSDKMELGDATKDFNKVVHYAIQVQKTRFRMWVNQAKVFDLPRAIPPSDTTNQLFFRMESSNYTDDEVGLFLSNIKIATGLPDARHKLVNEGKFSTTGILFDAATATLKPESAGVLKEVAAVLKEAVGIRLKITGHTDGDGDAAANLELSKARADAVKAALVKDHAVDETRLVTDGKGEAVPVGDNKTGEGKAQNRRVEFLKL